MGLPFYMGSSAGLLGAGDVDEVLKDMREGAMGITGGRTASHTYTQHVQRPCGRGGWCVGASSRRLMWLEDR